MREGYMAEVMDLAELMHNIPGSIFCVRDNDLATASYESRVCAVLSTPDDDVAAMHQWKREHHVKQAMALMRVLRED